MYKFVAAALIVRRNDTRLRFTIHQDPDYYDLKTTILAALCYFIRMADKHL